MLSEQALRYARSTNHVGVLDGDDVITVLHGTPGVSAAVRLQARCHDDVLTRLVFKADGRLAIFACCAYACEKLEGASLATLAARCDALLSVDALLDALVLEPSDLPHVLLVAEAVIDMVAAVMKK